MDELKELADALARRAIEHEPEAAMPFRDHVAAAIARGDHELAAAAIRFERAHAVPLRRCGYVGDIPPETEAAIKRQQALAAAGNFRRINKQNHTNHPLPAWVRSELGETF